MPTLSVKTRRIEGVTFVEGMIDADCRCRIRITILVDGPLWPPRNGGEPTPGWSGSQLVRTIDAGTTAFGFATPEALDADAVELVDSEPLEDEPPTGVAAWFRRIERRLHRAERIAAAETLTAATNAVADLGGLAAVERLAAAIARDRRLLSRIDVAPKRLLERAESVEVPTRTLVRLGRSDHSRRSW